MSHGDLPGRWVAFGPAPGRPGPRGRGAFTPSGSANAVPALARRMRPSSPRSADRGRASRPGRRRDRPMFPPLRLREAMSLGGLTVRELAVRTWKKINEHEILTRAAAVAFYAMLALVPFLALILTLTVQLLPDITGATGRARRGRQHDRRPARARPCAQLFPRRGVRGGRGPDRPDPEAAAGRPALGRPGHHDLAGVEPVRGDHRRDEPDLRRRARPGRSSSSAWRRS